MQRAAERERQPVNEDENPKRPMVKESDPWIETSDVIPMFPTLVWKIQLQAQLREAIDAKILATL